MVISRRGRANKGRHDLSHIFALDISDQERDVIANNLDENEYDAADGLREYTMDDLEEQSVRSCIKDYYHTIFENTLDK